MKITIWIRAQRDNPDAITLRLDTKYETYDRGDMPSWRDCEHGMRVLL